MRICCALILVCVGFWSNSVFASAAVQTVGGGQNIQDAINNASPNGTIFIVGRHEVPSGTPFLINTPGLKIVGQSGGLIDGHSTTVNATLTGNTASGSAVISGLSSTVNLRIGAAVTGIGIGASASIRSINSATQVTLTVVSTATATGVSLTFTSSPSDNDIFTITANNVSIQGLTLNNGVKQINCTGAVTGLYVYNCLSNNAIDCFVNSDSSASTVLSNTIRGCQGGTGLAAINFSPGSYSNASAPATKANILIQSNLIQKCLNGAVSATTDDVRLYNNLINLSEGATAVVIAGNFPVINSITVENTALDAISLTGPKAVVYNTLLQYGGGNGVVILGDQSRVTFNLAQHLEGQGYNITTQTNTAGTLVSSCTASNCLGEGFALNTFGATVSNNTTTLTQGYLVSSDSNFLTGNSANNVSVRGFLITGTSNTLTSCAVYYSAANGFDSEAATGVNTFKSVLAVNCAGQGFMVGSTGQASVSQSNFSNNRAGGNVTVGAGASFSIYTSNIPAGTTAGPAYGGAWPPPEIP